MTVCRISILLSFSPLVYWQHAPRMLPEAVVCNTLLPPHSAISSRHLCIFIFTVSYHPYTIDIKIEPKNIYDAYSTPIVQQTSFWSIVKERLGMHSCAFEFSVKNRDIYAGVGGFSRTNADFITFFQYLNHEDYIAYVPYGPEIEPSEVNQVTFLEELSEVLKSHLPKHCIALRYDFNWESHWCKREDFDADGNWMGLPKKEFQEIKLNYGTCNRNLWKANANNLPANTIVVDLTQTEQQLLDRMKPKTRYNIRLALRKGVEVK